MKFITTKFACLLLFMMASVSVFAQPADPDPTPDAPIDSNLYLLLFFGIAFMVYFFAKKKNVKG
jgi:hypothetical protein